MLKAKLTRQPLLKDKQTTRILLKLLLYHMPFALRFSIKVINVKQSNKVLSDTDLKNFYLQIVVFFYDNFSYKN